MKRLLLFGHIVWCIQFLWAQHYTLPKKVIIGLRPYVADYTGDTVQYSRVYSSYSPYPGNGCTLSIAFDSLGNILFWSNGMTVSTLHSPYMKGGDTLSDSDFHNNFRESGVTVPQTSLIVPSPNNPYLYYLIYTDLKETDSCYNRPVACLLYYAVVDMQANSGWGEVVSKRNLISDTFTMYAGLNAVRHANGHDWWLIKPDYGEYITGGYFVALIDSAGVHSFEHQSEVGAPKGTAYSNRAYTAFSPNGEWFASGGIVKEGYPIDSNRYTGFELLRFDRCTGKFSDCHTIIPPWKNPLYWALQPIFHHRADFCMLIMGQIYFSTICGRKI